MGKERELDRELDAARCHRFEILFELIGHLLHSLISIIQKVLSSGAMTLEFRKKNSSATYQKFCLSPKE